jgi:hypothetical protein
VAPRYTAPSSVCFAIVEADFDFSKGEFIAYSPFLFRSMNIMTGAAGPSLFLVHMQPVQVCRAVPEICYCLCLFDSCKGFFMTEEAETVFPFFIFSIKFMREGQPEDKGVIRAVRIMTGSAITLGNRTVLKTPLLPYIAFLMTTVTEGVKLIQKKGFNIRIVR